MIFKRFLWPRPGRPSIAERWYSALNVCDVMCFQGLLAAPAGHWIAAELSGALHAAASIQQQRQLLAAAAAAACTNCSSSSSSNQQQHATAACNSLTLGRMSFVLSCSYASIGRAALQPSDALN